MNTDMPELPTCPFCGLEMCFSPESEWATESVYHPIGSTCWINSFACSVDEWNTRTDTITPAPVYKSMSEAPKDGTPIIGRYADGEECEMVWSDRPVCMLGPRNGGFSAGWATCGAGVDSNLPLDEPEEWRHLPKVSPPIQDDEVENIAKALNFFIELTDDSTGVDGWHMNGDLAHWNEFGDEIGEAVEALATIKSRMPDTGVEG